MWKQVKLLLSVGLAFIFWPLMAIEMSLTISGDTAKGVIPEKGERDDYIYHLIMNCKILRFCLRMFHTDVETDEIIMEHIERRKKRNS